MRWGLVSTVTSRPRSSVIVIGKADGSGVGVGGGTGMSVGWGSGVGPQAVAIVNSITAIIKKQCILYMGVLSVYCSAVYHCCGTGGATGLTKQNPRPVQSGGQVEKPLARLTRGLSHGALGMALTPFLEGPQSAAGAGLLALLANGLWLIADS